MVGGGGGGRVGEHGSIQLMCASQVWFKARPQSRYFKTERYYIIRCVLLISFFVLAFYTQLMKVHGPKLFQVQGS